MKPKLSLSVIRLLYLNTEAIENDMTHKEVVQDILNSRRLLRDYIIELRYDIELTESDEEPVFQELNQTMKKSVKELSLLLKQ